MEENHPRAASDSALDKISNLPSLVIDQILCRLPIRDAVRTSVLASKWRFKWTTMSELVFYDEPINVIDQVLMLHIEAISKFKLERGRSKSISNTDLDRWILRLSRCHVQEFILQIWEREDHRYKLHSSLFSFQDLVHLELWGKCHLKLPSTFAGFKKLKKLELVDLVMPQDAFETLISSCLILERLTLLYVNHFNHLNIDAPNLLEFQFEGWFDHMNLINCSKLEEVSILLVIATERIKARDSSNLVKFFTSLPRIKSLKILVNFLKYLAAGDIPRQLPNPCADLGYLWLEIRNNDYASCSAALCLLRNSPNLQKLIILALKSTEGNEFTFWKSEHTNCSFNKLGKVYIETYALDKKELELIRFILLASPVLQKMTIKDYSGIDALKLSKELLRLQRASSKAEVIFLD